jgi:hypothetical protein
MPTKTYGNGNQTIVEGSDETVIVGNGNDSVTAGSNDLIAVGNGNDTISVGSSDALIVGNGNDTITAASNDIIAAGNGNDKISIGSNDALIVGDGNDTITAGSNDIIAAGNGNDTVTIGSSDALIVGNGNDTITAGSNDVVAAGNGNDTIAAGPNDVVLAGNGNDTVAIGSNTTVTLGNGNDTVSVAANDTVSVGKGNDTFIFQAAETPTLAAPTTLNVNAGGAIALPVSIGNGGFGHEVITGFSATRDKIQFDTAQFANFAGVMAQAKQSGSDTVIAYDANDSITLKGVTLSSLASKNFTFVTGSPASAETITITGIPADVTLSDTAGPLTVTNGSITLTPAQLAGLTLHAGTTSAALTVTVIGGSGVTATSVSQTIALTVSHSVVPPVVTEQLANDTGVSASDKITKDPTVTGSGDPNAVVHFTIDGNPIAGTVTANGSGLWTFTPTGLADGPHTIVATETNAAGTGSASLTFTLDRTIATPTIALTNDTGSSSSDKITKDASITVSAAAADVSRSFTVDGGPSSASYVAPTTDGSHTVMVIDADTAGNTASASLSGASPCRRKAVLCRGGFTTRPRHTTTS